MNYDFDKLIDKKEEVGCGAYLVAAIILIALAVGLSFLYAWVGILLWDWVIVGVLHWVEPGVMTFWPMWGLMELCSILFKTHNINTNNSNK